MVLVTKSFSFRITTNLYCHAVIHPRKGKHARLPLSRTLNNLSLDFLQVCPFERGLPCWLHDHFVAFVCWLLLCSQLPTQATCKVLRFPRQDQRSAQNHRAEGWDVFCWKYLTFSGVAMLFFFSPASSSDPKLRIKKTLKWVRLFVQTTIYDRWTTIYNEFHLSFSSNYTKRNASCLTSSDSFFSQKFWRLLHCSRQPIQRFLYSIS